MELIVKAVIDNELNQDLCVSYFYDPQSGEIRCGWYKE